jgi:hypothetical protein
MGPSVVPLILEELRLEPDQWFWALESITEQDPVPPEARGKVLLMAQAWVQWGEQEGILGHDTPDAVAGGIYGEVVAIMRRPCQQSASPPGST